MSIHSQIINPQSLDPVRRAALVDELFALNCDVFGGVERAAFERYLIPSAAIRVRIQVLRDDGFLAGYAVAQIYEHDSPERPLVFRTIVALRPVYRRQSLCSSFLAREGLCVRLAYPLRRLYGFACPVNPASYQVLARYTTELWPCPERETPPEIEALMGALATHFHLEEEADAPGVYHVGWCARQETGEAQAWTATQDAAARFYLERNPRYAEGYGLLVLVPLHIPMLLRALARLAMKRLRVRRAAPVPTQARVAS